MPENKGLKFGILCNSMNFHRWQAEIIRMLVQHGHEPALIIMNAEKAPSVPPAEKLKKYPWKHFLYRIYQRFYFKPAMKQEIDLSDELKKVPLQACQIRKVDFSEFFSDEDVDFIKNQELDFILRFGFNIIRGKILYAARYGIWSYHHADEQKYRGGPPCFWEIYHNDPVTGAVLQRLNEKLDAGVILRKGLFGTIKHSYRENLGRVYSGSIPWVLQVCTDIQNGKATYFDAPGSTTRARLYKAPENLQMLRFGIKLFVNRLKFHFKDILLSEKWNIGIIEAPTDKVAFNWKAYSKRIKWLPEPAAGTYVADPFIYTLGDVNRLVYEKYDYRSMQGNIEQLTLTNAHPDDEKVMVINDGTHFSFPYVFEHEVEVYCIPENAASGKTRLYRLSCSEKQFEPIAEISDKPLVDPVLFKFANYWWLFGTLPGFPSERLYIFYATNLLGPYHPHAGNPVKTDIFSSRPAGKPFVVEGTLYRPAQNCSKTYGGSIMINQVITLSPEEFQEQPSTELFPFRNWLYNKGMHTLSGNGGITVIDAKRMQFIPVASWNKLKRKLGISS